MMKATIFPARVTLTALLCLAMPFMAQADQPRLDYGSLDSQAMGRPMDYSVYTPPSWSVDERLPLLVLLHGGGDNHETFGKHGVDAYLDTEIGAGRVPRAVIVNPDGENGFWENWYDGSRMYRDWVMRDLLPVVQEQYNTLACPQDCHVMGFSMGAHGAMQFAFHEHESFSSVSVVSGMILTRDEVIPALRRSIWGWFFPFERVWGDLDDPEGPREQDPYVAWVENPDVRELGLFLSWGSRDKKVMISTGNRFRDHLNEHDARFSWWVYDGKHKWVDWQRVIAEALRIQVEGKPVHAMSES